MRVFALNTVGEGCEVGLWEDAKNLLIERLEVSKGHDEFLPKCTQALFSNSPFQLDEVDKIVVVAGPGSFTSVRVGVAFARGLGVALSKEVIGVSSLEAALPETANEGRVMVAVPAKRRPPEQTWWVQTFADGMIESEALEMDVAQIKDTAVHVQSVFAVAPDTLNEATGLNAQPTVSALKNAVQCAMRHKAGAINAQPQYVRAPDAVPAKKTL